MARPGVTYQDIAAAANELKGQGKSVTIENVRSILKTGSIGTINNHLRKWKEAQTISQKIASKENLPDELISLMKGLWEGVVDQSNHRFEPVEESYQNEITELKSELEKYRENNRRWQKMFNQWMQERVKLANEKLTIEQALEFAQKENAALNAKQDGLFQQLQEKQERIDELHRLHKQVQENLEYYRETAREQRLLDQQQFEQQKQQLQSDLKILQEQSIMQREKYAAIQQQHQSLEKSHAALKLRLSEENENSHKLRSELDESEKNRNEYLRSYQYWQNQFNEVQKNFENKISEFATTQAEIKMLSQKLDDTNQSLQDMLTQNKLLANEKWSLAQEKAQLEGQLKQLQKHFEKA